MKLQKYSKSSLCSRYKKEYGIERVEFYIDDVLKGTDAKYPYEWLWDEFAMGWYEIKVVAYDKNGNNASDNIMVRKFL